MPRLTLTVSDQQLAALDERAALVGRSRREYLLDLFFSLDRPVDEVELQRMVAGKAREGNMRAIEILARSMPVKATATTSEVEVEVDPDDPFAEVDELANRRAAR